VAKPDRPLGFHPYELKLREVRKLLAIFNNPDNLSNEGLGSFMEIVARVSDWTPEEMEELTLGELIEVFKNVNLALQGEQAAAVPTMTASS
jgi:hypothetical protein